MDSYRVSLREMRFFLWELHDLEQGVLTRSAFRGATRARIDAVLDQARAFARRLGEANPIGDRQACRLDAAGRVQLPAPFPALWAALRDDWAALLAGGRLPAGPPGSGATRAGYPATERAPTVPLPPLVAQVVCEMFMGANPSLMTYGGFNRAAIRLLELHGTAAQKRWIEPLKRWRWDACFCATEAGAGTDLSAVTARATALPDGSHAVRGEKLYVSAGRHDLTENTLYIVIARTDGAAPDSFALSCLIVPRRRIAADDTLGPDNHVDCIGLAGKMGLHGCANAHLVFGAGGTTHGHLLGGRPHVGLLQLRPLMSQARTGTAMFGLGVASSAYLQAVDHARRRIQGRPIESTADARTPRIAIIEHGDVQRMLLDMKSRVEGCRGLLGKLMAALTAATVLDAEPDAPPDAAERCRKLAQLLNPICKAFISDQAWHVCTQAIQVHGGLGYTDAAMVEQNARDVKILSIWEGSNYIQAQDLVRDKLGFGRHAQLIRYFREALEDCLTTHAACGADPAFARWFAALRRAADALERALARIARAVQSGAMPASSQFFTRFLAMFGTVGAAWALLEAACVAQRRLTEPAVLAHPGEAAFYRGKLKSAGYYYANVLPGVHTDADVIEAMDEAAWTASGDELDRGDDPQ